MTGDRDLIESLCDLQIPSELRFSPDGQRILYSTALTWNHVKSKDEPPLSTLWLAETGRPGSSRQLTTGLHKDCQPRWNPNGKEIAFISDRAKPGKQWAIYTLTLEAGTKAVAETCIEHEREISGFEYAPDGKSIAFISADEKTPEENSREEDGTDVQVWGESWPFGRLRVVDLATKKVTDLTSRATERHVSSLSWNRDGSRIAVTQTQTPHIEDPYLHGTTVHVVDVASGDSSCVSEFPSQIYDLTWAGDGKLYFRSGLPAGKSSAGKAVYSMALASDPATQLDSAFGIESDALGMTLTADDEVVVRLEHNLSSRIAFFNGRVLFSIDQDISAFAAAFPSDSDEVILAVVTSNINAPSEVYTTTASGGALVRLSGHGQRFEDKQFGSCSFISCPSTDGEVELNAVYLKTSDKAQNEPLPTLVLIHGGPDMRTTNAFNTWYYMWTPYLLRRNSYAGILLPNYRGSSGRGEEFASYSHRGMGVYDYADVIALVQHAITIGFVDKENIVVGGWSQGGYLSYLCAVRNGDHGHGWKFKAAIPGAGVCDWDTLTLTSDLGATLETELVGGYAPWSLDASDTRNRKGSALWEFSRAVKWAVKTKAIVVPPILILHGEKDERCPIEQARGFKRALDSVKLPYQYVIYPRQPHLFKEQKFWIDMALRVSHFVDRHIGLKEVAMNSES